MPDISMCPGGDCPHKEDCYRYRAEPDTHQSYIDFDAERLTGNCKSFMPIWPGTKKRLEKNSAG